MNRTEKLISDAFWQLLDEKPYNKITVQNIVERCQVNRNTFYYHFQNIQDLAECSIQNWAEEQIKANCKFGAPVNCIVPIAQEFTKRKRAFVRIYRSSRQDAFVQCLSEICVHTVRFYLSSVLDSTELLPEYKEMLVRYYKCTAFGIIMDWLNAGASYDLIDFCEKICVSFQGPGKSAFLKGRKVSPSFTL